ncbi:F-box/kelch-repeat protein [Hirschfeldia incana]|nr:F-box/kelch-repeat protein [Hirschfeldia incana]
MVTSKTPKTMYKKLIHFLGDALMETTKKNGRRRREEASPPSLELPPEIIREILIRLPAKSIGRFRCVSKLFRSLSSDPKFAKIHIDLTIRNDTVSPKLIVSSHNLYALDLDSIGCEGIRDLAAKELDYPLKEDPIKFDEMIKCHVGENLLRLNPERYRRNWVEIIGSSHGLVCISPCEGAVFLYNPTTGESKRLPEMITGEEFQTHGFGFHDDYKVVKLVADGENVLNASVYSLKEDTWRWIRDLSYEHKDCFSSGVTLDGAVHWVFTNDNQRVVLAFDVKTEEFREMLLPGEEAEDCAHSYRNFVVGVLNGRLCVVNSCYEVHDDVWVMNEYGVESSWSRIRISLLYRSMKPLCSSKNGEEVLLELDGDMVLYNFETDASRYLGIRGVKLSDGFEADAYVESLVSPNSYGFVN